MGWLSTPIYRRLITITEKSGSDLTDYQVKLVFNSDNFDFSKTQPDGSDIWFEDVNGNIIPHWIEKWDVYYSEGVIWIKIPSLLANSTVTVYMYYGSNNNKGTSNPNSVFIMYDDFNPNSLNEWIIGYGSWTVEEDSNEYGNYILKATKDASGNLVYKDIQISRDIIIDSKVLLPSSGNSKMPGVVFGMQDTNNFYMARIRYGRGLEIYKLTNGGFRLLGDLEYDLYTDVWYIISTVWKSDGTIILETDDGFRISVTDTTYMNGKFGLRSYGYGWYDWVRVRKYVEQEPSVNIGSEESTTVEWPYRIAIAITEQSGSDLTDYQVLIELDSDNFDFENANVDGSDIRFTDSDGTTKLPYYIEEWDSVNKIARIWVKVPSILANSTKTIYMYYGNPNTVSESDGDAVFEFFDDFEGTSLDTNKWSVAGGGTITVENSIVKITSSNNVASYIKTVQMFNMQNVVLEVKAMLADTTSTKYGSGIFVYYDGSNRALIWNKGEYSGYNRVVVVKGGTVEASDPAWNITNDFVVYRMDFTIQNTILKRYDSQTTYIHQALDYTLQYNIMLGDIASDAYHGTGEFDWVRIRKYASTEPQVYVGEVGGGWLEGWKYRRKIDFIESGNYADYTGFVAYIDVTDANFDLTKINSDGSDLVVTKADGSTVARYWVRPLESGGFRVYFRVEDVLDGGYLYYGNSTPNISGNPNDVFLFFDDYDSVDFTNVYIGKRSSGSTSWTCDVETTFNVTNSTVNVRPNKYRGCSMLQLRNSLLYNTGNDVKFEVRYRSSTNSYYRNHYARVFFTDSTGNLTGYIGNYSKSNHVYIWGFALYVHDGSSSSYYRNGSTYLNDTSYHYQEAWTDKVNGKSYAIFRKNGWSQTVSVGKIPNLSASSNLNIFVGTYDDYGGGGSSAGLYLDKFIAYYYDPNANVDVGLEESLGGDKYSNSLIDSTVLAEKYFDDIRRHIAEILNSFKSVLKSNTGKGINDSYDVLSSKIFMTDKYFVDKNNIDGNFVLLSNRLFDELVNCNNIKVSFNNYKNYTTYISLNVLSLVNNPAHNNYDILTSTELSERRVISKALNFKEIIGDIPELNTCYSFSNILNAVDGYNNSVSRGVDRELIGTADLDSLTAYRVQSNSVLFSDILTDMLNKKEFDFVKANLMQERHTCISSYTSLHNVDILRKDPMFINFDSFDILTVFDYIIGHMYSLAHSELVSVLDVVMKGCNLSITDAWNIIENIRRFTNSIEHTVFYLLEELSRRIMIKFGDFGTLLDSVFLIVNLPYFVDIKLGDMQTSIINLKKEELLECIDSDEKNSCIGFKEIWRVFGKIKKIPIIPRLEEVTLSSSRRLALFKSNYSKVSNVEYRYTILHKPPSFEHISSFDKRVINTSKIGTDYSKFDILELQKRIIIAKLTQLYTLIASMHDINISKESIVSNITHSKIDISKVNKDVFSEVEQRLFCTSSFDEDFVVIKDVQMTDVKLILRDYLSEQISYLVTLLYLLIELGEILDSVDVISHIAYKIIGIIKLASSVVDRIDLDTDVVDVISFRVKFTDEIVLDVIRWDKEELGDMVYQSIYYNY